jgi:hypothetical protein
LDVRLGVAVDAAFERLRRQAGLALQLVGRPAAFEVLATPLRSPYEDDALVRCVLRGRLTADTRGCIARARILVRSHGPDPRLCTGGWPWTAALTPSTAMLSAMDRLARLRRQRRAMLSLWSHALAPVVVVGGDDPFRGAMSMLDATG